MRSTFICLWHAVMAPPTTHYREVMRCWRNLKISFLQTKFTAVWNPGAYSQGAIKMQKKLQLQTLSSPFFQKPEKITDLFCERAEQEQLGNVVEISVWLCHQSDVGDEYLLLRAGPNTEHFLNHPQLPRWIRFVLFTHCFHRKCSDGEETI